MRARMRCSHWRAIGLAVLWMVLVPAQQSSYSRHKGWKEWLVRTRLAAVSKQEYPEDDKIAQRARIEVWQSFLLPSVTPVSRDWRASERNKRPNQRGQQ